MLFASGWFHLAAASSPETSLETDAAMVRSLDRIAASLQLRSLIETKKLALSLVDVTDPSHPRYAGINDQEMMYAASLPKICVFVAGFEAIRQGLLNYTPQTREMFTRIARFSSNVDASHAIQMIGFEYIAKVLTSQKYQFYNPALGGGLWLGKAYGGPNDYWKRDPMHNLSHGATSLQVARYFTMLAQGKLVDAAASEEIKEIMSKPGINHKFVKGLSQTPGVNIYRKSGSWEHWHSDAALVEHNGKKYVAVALADDSQGGKILEKLIVELDKVVVSPQASNTRPASAPISGVSF